MLDPRTYEFPSEAEVFARPTIQLTSPNAIPQWKMALWIGTIWALSTVAIVAFTLPQTIERVNVAHMEDLK